VHQRPKVAIWRFREPSDAESSATKQVFGRTPGISRREADDAIAAGKVTVDGEKAVLGARIRLPEADGAASEAKNTPSEARESVNDIDFSHEVCYNGRIVPFLTGYTYLALNKPVGYVCSRKRQGEAATIYELLPEKYRALKTVGRLDKDSSGLILLTTDGDFGFQMTHPKFVKTKVYEVELDRALEPLHQQMIADFGIEIGDGVSRLGLERLDEGRRRWRVTMNEGRNRQIRRTFGALGYTVTGLHRTDFGKYHLDGLKAGKFVEFRV